MACPLSSAGQHNADSGQNLPVVVQIACHLAKSPLLHFNAFPGKHAQLFRLRLELFRQVVQALEGFAVRLQGVAVPRMLHEEEHFNENQDVRGHTCR